MKKFLTLLAFVGIAGAVALPAQADPQSDLKEFQGYFKKKFPKVKFDEYANGLYALPEFNDYRKMWESYNEFPPYEIGLEKGKARWNKKFANGGSFDSCVKKGVIKPANTYPRWDKAAKEVRTAEMDIIECMRQNGDTTAVERYSDLEKDDKKERVELAELTAHFYSMYRGKRVKPDVDFRDSAALAAYEDGKKFYWTRRGQLNFACSHCHVELSGKDLGGAQPLSAGLGHPVGWPAQRLQWARLETIHFRYVTCNDQVRAKPAKHGSATFNNLQLYETYMSSGLPLTAPSMRN